MCRGEVEHDGAKQGEILLLLPELNGRRVFPGRGEIPATAGTVDLDQALGPAADRADLDTFGRARSAGFPDTAERTEHGSL